MTTTAQGQGDSVLDSQATTSRADGGGDASEPRGWRMVPSGQGLGTLVFVAIAMATVLAGGPYALYTGTLICIYAIVTVSQEWILGRAGLVSLGSAAIMAIGAYTTARLSETSWGLFPVPLLVSFVFGGIVGLLIGVPGLRFKGLYLMLTTLALQFIVMFAGQKYQGVEHEAGFLVTPPTWGSLPLNTPKALFIITAVVLGLVLFALSGIYRGVPGRVWNAMRQDEAAASVLGAHLVRWKLAAFIGSSAITAVGGSLYAYQAGQVSYNSFSLELSLTLLVMVFIGGLGTLAGPVIGAAVIVLLPILLDDLADAFAGLPDVANWLFINQATLANGLYGLLLLLVLLFERDGIFGLGRRLGRGALGMGRRLTTTRGEN